MAVGLAIPPQISERNMPEGTRAFKPHRRRVSGKQGPGGFLRSPAPKQSYSWLATVTPRRFCDQQPSEASGHSGRSLPYEMTVIRLASMPSAVR